MLSGFRLGCGALLLLVAASCERVPLLAPTSSIITITSDVLALPAGGSTQVAALIMESSGTAVQNGTTVRFSTTLGRVDPVEAETRGGRAVTTFYAGDLSGTASVRALSGGAAGTGDTANGATATDVVQIQVGGAAAAALTLSASTSTVPSAGGTITITAAALDAAGNSLKRVPVSFSTTAGTLSASSVITDEAGQASTSLTTNRGATVTARVGTGEATRTATLTINAATPNSIALAVLPSPATVNQPVILTVTPTLGTNNIAPRVVVEWGDGSTTDLGIVGGPRTVAHTYTKTGDFIITATATAEGETTSGSTVLTVNARVLNVTVTASPSPPPTTTTPVTFTALVNAPGETLAVTTYRWTITGGTGAENVSETTTGNTLTRSFSSAGTKTVSVTVTTDDERTGTGQTTVVVPAAAAP
jgi:hypothetical protein